MTTPQNELYRLSQRVWDLYNLFQPKDENEEDIFQKIKQMELQMLDIMSAQQRQENLMGLIVKLLNKKENND
jgi:hypothetical protein